MRYLMKAIMATATWHPYIAPHTPHWTQQLQPGPGWRTAPLRRRKHHQRHHSL